MQKLNTIQVSEFEGTLPSLLEYFCCKAQMFTAGSIPAYSHKRQDLTSDPEVLETVTGQKIEFDTWLKQLKPLMQPKLSDIQSVSIDLEIAQLLQKGIIQPCYHKAGEFISPVFTRPKKDGSFQMILKLKSFNTHVTNHHFKMDNIWTAIRTMKPGCYMASIDLKDAYYSVPISTTDQKFLKFEWKGTLYQFTCFHKNLQNCINQFSPF